eukprot:TRINITY_DN17435_c0_g1_i2.p1 TRINITY_DN17435_c0_g1~~TRINITY_DN17435_c0_g1_i2.p1  ORF type:complete len:557 (+),score=81.52 TRINITY_DN17435_c0_g1_i2:88-1671(+)
MAPCALRHGAAGSPLPGASCISAPWRRSYRWSFAVAALAVAAAAASAFAFDNVGPASAALPAGTTSPEPVQVRVFALAVTTAVAAAAATVVACIGWPKRPGNSPSRHRPVPTALDGKVAFETRSRCAAISPQSSPWAKSSPHSEPRQGLTRFLSCSCWRICSPPEESLPRKPTPTQAARTVSPLGESQAQGPVVVNPQGGLQAHPKYCGLRMKSPTDDVNVQAFAYSPCPDFPESWHSQVPFANAGEREQCEALRLEIADVPGPKDTVTLLRFLRSRAGNVAQTARMYETSMRCTVQTHLVDGFRSGSIDDTLHQCLDEFWRVFGFIGHDRDGDPVVWERPGLTSFWTLAKIPVEFLVKHEVYMITRIMQAMEERMHRDNRPIVGLTCVVDVGDLGLQDIHFPFFRKLSAVIKMAEANFPELLKKVLIIRTPWLFDKLFKIASPLICEGTQKKFLIAGVPGKEGIAAFLKQHIDPKWIPECYGGDMRFNNSADCKPLLPWPKKKNDKKFEALAKRITASCEEAKRNR